MGITQTEPSVISTAEVVAASLGRTPETIVHKFGLNPAVGNAATEHIWSEGGNLTWPTSASAMDVSSSSVNDTNTAGTGARTIMVEGLDSNFDELSESMDLNGTSTVTTSGSFVRVNRAYCTSWGTYHGTNDGKITIQVTGGGSIQATIESDELFLGQTVKTQYTIPNGQQGLLLNISTSPDSSKTAQLSMYQAQNADDTSAPFTCGERVVFTLGGLGAPYSSELRTFPLFPGKTDLWWIGKASTGNASVSVEYDILLFNE